MNNLVSESLLQKPVGILGGGQLSRMLVHAADGLKLKARVWAETSDSPAAKTGVATVVGKYAEINALREYLSQVGVVAFENEFLDCDLLALASKGLKMEFSPSLETIRQWQDKLSQKKLLESCQVPSAPFVVLETSKDDESGIDAWLESLGALYGTAVLKWARFGYDGKGVHIHSPGAPLHGARSFCQEGMLKGSRIYAETRVPFQRELALVATAGRDGSIVTYPLVVSEQRNGVCYRVEGPARALGVAPALELRAQAYAAALARASGIIGTFAIEMFELPGNELWVNELAPRVHNSGHFTQDACRTSQFENHWRALTGLKLGETGATPAFAMLNLLGPPGVSMTVSTGADAGAGAGAPEALPEGCHWHWYDKDELRPGRKMGHVNGTARDPGELPELRARLELVEKEWIGSFAKRSSRDA